MSGIIEYISVTQYSANGNIYYFNNNEQAVSGQYAMIGSN